MRARCVSAGIPEELLVGELDALSPHSARRLLGMLLHDGLISVRQVEAAPAPQPPGIFRRLRQQLHPEPKVPLACLPAAMRRCLQVQQALRWRSEETGLAAPLEFAKLPWPGLSWHIPHSYSVGVLC